jgi:hypothetical protein
MFMYATKAPETKKPKILVYELRPSLFKFFDFQEHYTHTHRHTHTFTQTTQSHINKITQYTKHFFLYNRRED